jgi:hypothetical protein
MRETKLAIRRGGEIMMDRMTVLIPITGSSTVLSWLSNF